MLILIMYQCVYYKYYSFTHFIRNVSEAPVMDIMTSQAFSAKDSTSYLKYSSPSIYVITVFPDAVYVPLPEPKNSRLEMYVELTENNFTRI